jgi:hypothetical protein
MVDRGLKMFGLSRSSRTVERRRRTKLVSDCTSTDDVVEIRRLRSLSNVLAGMCLVVVALTFLTAEVFVPRQGQTGCEVLPKLYLLLLIMGALAYLLRYILALRLDGAGVTERSLVSFREFIPWNRIASCDLVVHRSTFGELAVACPRIKDGNGKDLMPTLGTALATASRSEQQKVLSCFRRRFPKLDLDPWEL